MSSFREEHCFKMSSFRVQTQMLGFRVQTQMSGFREQSLKCRVLEKNTVQSTDSNVGFQRRTKSQMSRLRSEKNRLNVEFQSTDSNVEFQSTD